MLDEFLKLRDKSDNIRNLCSQIEAITSTKSRLTVKVKCRKCGARYIFWDIRMLDSWHLESGMKYTCKGIPKFGNVDTNCGNTLTYNPLSRKLVRKAMIDRHRLIDSKCESI